MEIFDLEIGVLESGFVLDAKSRSFLPKTGGAHRARLSFQGFRVPGDGMLSAVE